MSRLYLSTQWEVNLQQIDDLRQIDTLTKTVEGKLRIIPDVYFREDKQYIDTLVVSVPQTGYEEWLQESEAISGFSWVLCGVELWDNTLIFEPFGLTGYVLKTWNARLRMAHQHNQRHPIRRPRPHLYPDTLPKIDPTDRALRALRRTGLTDETTIELFKELLSTLHDGPDAMEAIRRLDITKLEQLIQRLREE